MWYVFPQVTGLGASEMARRYAIETVDEAEAFLIHPVLGADYLRIVDEAWRQIVEHGMSVEALLGSPDDAKLVSSLTLFAGVARRLDGPEAALTVFVTRADEILRSAFAEGLRRCAITEGFLQ